MIKFMKTFTCEVPVRDADGNATDEKRTAVKALFSKATKGLGGLKNSYAYGSLFLDEGVTEEEANEVLDVDADYSDEVRFLAIEGSKWFNVVLK